MHKGHTHNHGHSHDHPHEGIETLRELQGVLEHWLEHDASHTEHYKEWAAKASGAGEEEIAKEIYLAIQESDAATAHLKRAKAILSAKLVLMK
jgi:hypothetical protein